MLRRTLLGATAIVGCLWLLASPGVQAVDDSSSVERLQVDEFTLSEAQSTTLRERWVQQLLSKYGTGNWAPMKMELEDSDLALMGLPPKKVLLAHRYPTPTTFDAKGRPQQAADSGTAAFAGTGSFGVRPGGWLLLINRGSIGWCSFAHVYGTPAKFSISTAGHCGKVGDVATVIGVVGNRTPVLMDIGKFSKSTGDGGIGKDWALISVIPEYQHLVTPTMAFWGGPLGTYTKTGEVVAADLNRPLRPSVTPNPDPMLAQGVVHYGHGIGLGAGGTPRSGAAINWRSASFTAFGAISPGDSGSGSNTLTGDTLGANRECAGINTHLYVDASLRTGLGVFAGTRCTLVSAALANGQILPYPAPTPVPLP